MTRQRHCLCGRPIHRQSRSGRCASCAQFARNTPELVARRAATLRRRLETEPALRALYTSQVKANNAGRANDYRLRRLRAAKLPDWVPIDMRDLYRELRDARLTPDEIREAMDNQTAADARAFAATGRLPNEARP